MRGANFRRIPGSAAAAVCILLLATAHAKRSTEPSLPAWEPGERDQLEADGWIAGGLLLTDETVEAPSAESGLDVAEPTAEEIAAPEIPADEIPEVFWPAYFGERPTSFLVDPQGLLSPVESKDRLAFLNYHAGDSSIDLFAYVFKGDQEIPGEVREEELIERFFASGRPAAVVYFYMGAPQRSVLYLSPSLTDAVSAAEQRRALESSVMQAFQDVDPSRQIEAFLVQMSIRIYWMERILGGGASAGDGMPVLVRGPVTERSESRLYRVIEPHLAGIRRHVLPLALAASTILAALLITGWLRRRARYQFPEIEVEPRLGGSHAAGVGAVISFASAALPPASQRDQVPDYLRRA
jgi:hypothetical protein